MAAFPAAPSPGHPERVPRPPDDPQRFPRPRGRVARQQRGLLRRPQQLPQRGPGPRPGIPISLSILWIEIGRRVGIPLQGVDSPGHFLLRHARFRRSSSILRGGRLLTQDDCRTLLERVSGGRMNFHPRPPQAGGQPPHAAAPARQPARDLPIAATWRGRSRCSTARGSWIREDLDVLRDRGLLRLQWGTGRRHRGSGGAAGDRALRSGRGGTRSAWWPRPGAGSTWSIERRSGRGLPRRPEVLHPEDAVAAPAVAQGEADAECSR